MAQLFYRRFGDKTYEVRAAGASLRLYTNGAFHSQWHPNRVFQGAVWDCLTLPALLLNNPPQSALILGVGGGTACHQLQRIAPLSRSVGIDCDSEHLAIAQRFFNLRYPGLDLLCEDAVRYVERDRTFYGHLIDDLFLDGPEDPLRPDLNEEIWLKLLSSRLADSGVLVQNRLEVAKAKAFFRQHRAFFSATFDRVLLLSAQHYSNGILAAFRGPQARLSPEVLFSEGLKQRGISTQGLKRIKATWLQ